MNKSRQAIADRAEHIRKGVVEADRDTAIVDKVGLIRGAIDQIY